MTFEKVTVPPTTAPRWVRRAIPADARISTWTAPDGWALRRFDWPATRPRGRLLFQTGRGDIFEKYLESLAHLHAQDWSVTAFDWRGQGGSGRLSANAHVGHASDFGVFDDDLAAFWAAWRGEGDGPTAVIGHSMGGMMVMRALANRSIRPDAAVLVAPMIGLRAPLGARFGAAIARYMTRCGDPARAAWRSNERPGTIASRQTLLTHDDARYDDERWWQARHPELKLGPPSWAWLSQAFDGASALAADPRVETIETPVLMMVAEADRLVDPRAALRLAARLPDAQVVLFGRDSAHEILREADGVRKRAFAAIDAFLDAPRAAMTYDIAIVGAGMAGASLAAAIGSRASVVLLEGEATPGYHATGRSAAFWSETYGGPGIQPLTSASGPLLRDYLSPLGSLHIGRAADAANADAFVRDFADTDVPLEHVDPAAYIPGLRDDWTIGVLEPSCAYIDVAALHAAKIARARRVGVDIVTGASLQAASRDGDVWTIDADAGRFRARVLVDAAGAWADAVAVRAGVRPLGLQAYRRTMVQLRTDPGARDGMPHVADLSGRFYFKPEPGGRLWLSPHDETPTDPCDAAPEELDVAIAIDRFEGVVDWRVAAVERRWAGLRTFAPDRLPGLWLRRGCARVSSGVRGRAASASRLPLPAR